MECLSIQGTHGPKVISRPGTHLENIILTHVTIADWQVLCASVADTSTKDEFTSVLTKWLGQTPANFAFPDLYDAINGE